MRRRPSPTDRPLMAGTCLMADTEAAVPSNLAITVVAVPTKAGS
jgi:hypothetical protein